MSNQAWLDGQRVVKIDTGMRGTFAAAGHLAKVTWDDGEVTYFEHHRPEKVKAVRSPT